MGCADTGLTRASTAAWAHQHLRAPITPAGALGEPSWRAGGGSEREGFWTLEAGIFPRTRRASPARGRGFRLVGIRERIGQCRWRWRDVLLYERRSAPPAERRPCGRPTGPNLAGWHGTIHVCSECGIQSASGTVSARVRGWNRSLRSATRGGEGRTRRQEAGGDRSGARLLRGRALAASPAARRAAPYSVWRPASESSTGFSGEARAGSLVLLGGSPGIASPP